MCFYVSTTNLYFVCYIIMKRDISAKLLLLCVYYKEESHTKDLLSIQIDKHEIYPMY